VPVWAVRNEEKWFPRKKSAPTPAKRGSPLPGRTDIEGNEEKWFRKENMPGSFFIAELERPPEIPGRGQFRERPKS
jgi:hypothetical protein